MCQSSCYWRGNSCVSAIGSRGCRTGGLWWNDSFSLSLQEWHYFLRGQELFFFDGMVVQLHASPCRKGQEAKVWMIIYHIVWRNIFETVCPRSKLMSVIVHSKWYITNNNYYNFGTHAISLPVVLLVTEKSSLCSISSASFSSHGPYLSNSCHV